MKSSRIIAVLFCALCIAACSPKASVKGELEGAPGKNVVVKLLDVNVYNVLDTVKTNASGRFSYKVKVQKGQPEFVYFFYGDTKIASLLLKKGDKVKVVSDTLGHWTVSGSEECEKLREVENAFADFAAKMGSDSGQATVKTYVDYYRDCVRYVMANPYSLTTIPVLYQNLDGSLPVFSQSTDAILFRNAADSLLTVYPDSKYVKALDKEATRRQQLLGLENRFNQAVEIGFPDFTLPDINGKKLSVSDIDARVIMVYFWSAEDAAQKMFNLDALLPLYKDFHDKGFEICAVSLDTDKALWATTIRNQKLPWVNLCDGKGAASPVVPLYNISALPAMFLIEDGEILARPIDGEAAMRSELRRFLK